MKRFLVRCYPARWRQRYGEEFAEILAERPLGPFDVADVLLGALDAHLHLRGLGAASEHAKGFAMSLRIGGSAAISGGLLWLLAMVGGSGVFGGGDNGLWATLLAVGTIALLAGLVGLSAFQARTYPRLIWAAFLVPAVGAITAIVGLVAMATVGDRPFVAGVSPWYLWMIGTATLFVGSALFGVATWLSKTLSRGASLLLIAVPWVVIPVILLDIGSKLPAAVAGGLVFVVAASFAAGWAWLGLSALRLDRRRPATMSGAALP